MLRCGVRGVIWLLGATGCQVVFPFEANNEPRLELDFEDDVDDGRASDVSGNGNDAALVDVLRSERNGEGAVALGLTSKISLEPINTLNFPGPLSFEVFFKMDGGTGTQALIDNENQYGSTINADLFNVTCTFIFGFFDFSSPGSPIGSVEVGRWHHLSCVHDPERGAIVYLDGTERAIDPAAANRAIATNGGGRVTIGGFSDDTSKFLGELDDVRIFPRVRLESEILRTVNEE